MQLPGHLMPPSLRQLNLTGGGGAVEVESTVTAATLAQAAQSDNPEVRQLVEEMEKLMEERKEADTQVNQLENDMTAKNSAIRNLQVCFVYFLFTKLFFRSSSKPSQELSNSSRDKRLKPRGDSVIWTSKLVSWRQPEWLSLLKEPKLLRDWPS